MATYVKFNSFTQQLVLGNHDWDAHVFKVMLTNVAPAATNDTKADLTEITAGFGYTAGGSATTITTSFGDPTITVHGTQVVFTATGGTIGPFRYVVLYNSNGAADANRLLVAYWDYGTSITLNDGETFTVKFNNASPGTIFTLT